MAQDEVEVVLGGEPEAAQVSVLRQDVAQLDMLVLQGSFLAGLHGVAEEDPGAPGAVRGSLHILCRSKLAPPVSEEDVHVLAEDGRGEDLLQEADAGEHGGRSLLLVEECKEQASLDELECLDEGASGLAVVDSVHLSDEGGGVLGKIRAVVPVGAPLEEAPVLALLVGGGLVLGELSGDLPAQVHDGYARHFMEHARLDVVIEGLFADPEFRMRLEDLVGGETLAQERGDDVGHGHGLCGSEADPGPGVRQRLPVDGLGLFGVILVLVETASAAVGTAVAGTGRAVTAGAAEGRVVGTVGRALPVEGAFPVGGALQRQGAFLHEDAVCLDFLANSGLVLADGLCDGGLGRAVGDAFEDDASFFQCQMGIGISVFHSVTSSQGGICRQGKCTTKCHLFSSGS